jgi:plasmid replication initiation protein
MTELVVKSNELIKASYTLGLVEQRIILMAIVQARETGNGITESTLLTIRAHDYAVLFGVAKQTAYQALSEAVETLFNRRVTVWQFIDDIYEPVTVRWVTAMSHKPNSGLIRLRFGIEVVPEITRLEENFTSYELEQVAGLKSAYAVRLYELLIQWRTTGKPPAFELIEFRGQLGVEDGEYPRIDNFKRFVLDIAVKQINENTDITATYTQVKSGRTITGFIFKFKQKTKAIDAPQKPQKPEPPKASTSFAGLQLVLLNQIQKNHPEITEKYVRDYAEQSGLDIVQVLEKIKLDYKAAEEFSLEKTN